MRQRCGNPRNASFENYGARGIRVCAAWRDSFETFFAHVGRRPSPKHSLDRVDNDGNYEPGNVRWATPEQQQGNTRSNRIVEAFGERKILSDWARDRGIPLDTLWRRLTIWKWPPERALSTPVPPKQDALTDLVLDAGFDSVSAFLKQSGVSSATFYKLGRKPLRSSSLTKIAVALGVPADRLLSL